MKIAKHVGDLLYDYECVVIPGLGGFLTQEKPSSINPVTHQFRPPYKQISFNAFLKTNDGLLVNYVARQEGMDYKTAKEQVDHFVLQCDRALHEGKKINFHNVGFLYLNDNQQIVFSQDTGINYNSEAFGLGSFVSPAITRTTAEDKIHEKVTAKVDKTLNKKATDKKIKTVAPQEETTQPRTSGSPSVASERRSPYRQQVTFLALLILAMMVGWGFMNKDKVQHYYSNYSSIIPLFSSTPNAYLIDNAHKMVNPNSKSGLWIMNLFSENKAKSTTPVRKAENKMPPVGTTVAKKSPAQSHPVEPATKTPETTTNQKTVLADNDKKTTPVIREKVAVPQQQPAATPAQKHFYIIAGAFREKSNADGLIHKLRLKGYQATQAGVTSTGLYRVAFGDFDNRRQAQDQLLAIREKENPSAWIFEQ
ncbi:MAG: SPOR domain-containing protein [Bacteroidales bacterium]|nr:SPOR domain-containing protein [Bacteroidales bacterium]